MAASEPIEFRSTERFRLVRRLGSGGMGVVYEALDRESNQLVALKTLRKMNANALLRFKNEFRALAYLAHPNLVNLGELFEQNGRLFFTMELLRGVDFLQYTRPHSPLPRQEPSHEAASPWDSQTTQALGSDAPSSGASTETVEQAFRELDAQLESPATSAPVKTHESDAKESLETIPGLGFTSTNSANPDTSGQTGSTNSLTDGAPRSPSEHDGFDETRLRAAALQLARGVRALHQAGKVHRDIKPSNIMVTGDGRVVLLDFGLVADVGRDRITQANRLIGTVRYMAPEQARNAEVGSAADWYSVGVLLYTALTGSAPFSGPVRAVLTAKATQQPPPPMLRDERVPRDLSELCSQLLCINPDARPSGDEILARLSITGHGSIVPSLPRRATQPLVGRQRELVALGEMMARTQDGEPLVCLVHGESGIGKSVLVEHFTSRARTEQGCTVLFGRCYQRESVAYKAVDELIDELAGHLSTVPRDEIEAMLPDRAGLLAQLFPVLGRIAAMPDGVSPEDSALPVHDRRVLAFMACRQLLASLSRDHVLVLVIDDLQWSDVDSLALLDELLRPPDAPRVFLIATVRTSSGASVGPWDVEALRDALPCATRELELARLPPDEARELVVQLSAETSGEIDVSRLVAEAGGHPLFLDVLVRHRRATPADTGELRLEDAMWWQIQSLDPEERELLELLSVAGRPVIRDVISSSISPNISGDRSSFDRNLASLIGSRLAAAGGNLPSDLIDVFHNRVREAVLGHLAEDHRQRLHLRLALALEEHGNADPELLATHWLAAGDSQRAAGYYELAAENARIIWAFDRAARLYQQCLDLYPPHDVSGDVSGDNASDVEFNDLRITLADALVDAGRSTQAAREYIAAARLAEPGDALELRRRAAEQLLRSGHVDEGVEVLAEVLHSVGLRLPRTPRRALARLLIHRAWLRLRGYRHRRRSEDQLPPEQLARLDACWVAATSLMLFSPTLGFLFQSYHFALAVAAGEPVRLARAMAIEACYACTPGGFARQRTERLLDEAMDLAEQVGDPAALAWAVSAQGGAAYLMGDWARAREKCTEAERMLLAVPTPTRWQIDIARQFILGAATMLGDFRALRAVLPIRTREAEERHDMYAAVGLRTGHINTVWLADDDPERARREAEEAVRHFPQGGFYVQHYYDMLAQTHIDLYEGKVASAWQRMARAWPHFRRSMITRVQQLRIFATYLRARTHIALAAADPLAVGKALSARRRVGLLRAAWRCSRKLEREKMPWASALAAAVRASCANLRGERQETLEHLDDALERFEDTDMRVHAAAARRARGLLTGSLTDEGSHHGDVAAAEGWLSDQGVRNPARLAALYLPGFSESAGSPGELPTAKHRRALQSPQES